MRRTTQLLSAAALVAAVSLAAPASAAGHVVVRPDTPAAVLAVTVTASGATSPGVNAKVTVLLDGDVGRLSAQLPSGGPVVDLRVSVTQGASSYLLYAATGTTAPLTRLGAIAPGGSLDLAGPAKSTITVTLVKMTTLAALRHP